MSTPVTVTNADARILERADRLGDDLAHRLVHAPHPLAHSTLTTSRVDADELALLAAQVALRVVEQPLELAQLARRERGGQAGALPELVVGDLGDRRAEAVLQLGLRGLARTCACP